MWSRFWYILFREMHERVCENILPSLNWLEGCMSLHLATATPTTKPSFFQSLHNLTAKGSCHLASIPENTRFTTTVFQNSSPFQKRNTSPLSAGQYHRPEDARNFPKVAATYRRSANILECTLHLLPVPSSLFETHTAALYIYNTPALAPIISEKKLQRTLLSHQAA
jgi:hypothetical protein